MGKYVIIFCAGASYGADNNNLAPPLGGNLFSALNSYN